MRYFIVFYSGSTKEGKAVYGNGTIHGSRYPNVYKTVNHIKEDNLKKGLDTPSITITCVNEITEQDYKDWIHNEL